jgi:hypothetical protein
MSYIGTFSALSKNGYQAPGAGANNIWTNIQTLTTASTFGARNIAINATGEYFAYGTVISSGAGYVYIYYNSNIASPGGGWTLQATLTLSTANDFFGDGLSFNDAGNILAIAAPNETSGRGAVYIYTRSGTTWTQQQRLTVSDPTINDDLGSVLSINGAGTALLASAAPKTVSGLVRAGAVYYFSYSGSTWSQTQKITATGAGLGREYKFGNDLAISQDGNYFVVGSPGYGSTAPFYQDGVGAISIYQKSGSTYAFQTRLQGTGVVAGTEFGLGVGITNTGDSVFSRARNLNYIWFFDRTGSSWTETQRLDYYAYGTLVNRTSTYNTGWKGDGSTVILGTWTNDDVLMINKNITYAINQELTVATPPIPSNFGQGARIARTANIAIVSNGQGDGIWLYALL